jgi:glutathione S-transferase
MREVHGKRECPFAWRVRIVAREKELPFEWIPFDAPNPDPRAARNNPEKKSPKLVEDGFSLIESVAIAAYLDEAYPGVPLQALGARERAQMRVRISQLAALEVHAQPQMEAKALEKVGQGYETLDRLLADGRQWLGGSKPDLSDVVVWPFLILLDQYRHSPDQPRLQAYLSRVKDRESLTNTRPR